MFFREIKFKKGGKHRVTLADVHLPVRLGHRDAAKVFGAPLTAQLAAASLGTVMSCTPRTRGTEKTAIGVDIALGLRKTDEATLKSVAGMLEALSAPCGSSIRLSETVGDPLLFGWTEGLELAIDTPYAPNPEMRRELALTCRDALERRGVSRGWDQRKDKTLFYFYGENFADMRARRARVLDPGAPYGVATFRRMA